MYLTSYIRGDSLQKRETCSQNRETTYKREGSSQKRVEEDYLYKGDSLQKRETCSQKMELTTYIREGSSQKRDEEEYLYNRG